MMMRLYHSNLLHKKPSKPASSSWPTLPPINTKPRPSRTKTPQLLFIISIIATATILLNIAHTRLSSGCRSLGGVPTRLESNLMEGFYHLRYDADVLRGERDKLLNISFANVPLGEEERKGAEAGTAKPVLFMFIGVFSEGHAVAKRDAVRTAWCSAAEQQASAVCRFIIYGNEKTAELQGESAALHDLLFTDDQLPVDKYLVRKTYFLFKYALEHYDVRFVLKTGDDSFVNVPLLVEELKTQCRHASCVRERLYFGKEMRNSEVQPSINTPGDEEYLRHTSLKKYMPYMLGGGYVLSADLAQVILGINRQSKEQNLLKLMASEDVTIGFWLMSVELRRVDHPKMLTGSAPCCFAPVTRVPGTIQEARAPFRTLRDVCRQQWLVLHRVQHTDEMRYLGLQAERCAVLQGLRDRALFLATARGGQGGGAMVDDGKVVRVSEHARDQYVLGNLQGTVMSANERYIAATQLQATAVVGQRVDIGVLKLGKNNQWSWVPLDHSFAWNTQLPPHIFWMGRSNRYLIFNDLACSFQPNIPTTCGIVLDRYTLRRTRLLPKPIVAMAHDGRMGISVSLQRLEIARPGHGEPLTPAAVDALLQDPCPSKDGLWVVDVATGGARLVVSYAQALEAVVGTEGGAGRDPRSGVEYPKQRAHPPAVPSMCWHWMDVPMMNREGTDIVFQYHISNCSDDNTPIVGHWSYLFAVAVDGSDLWRIPVMPMEEGSMDFGRNGQLILCGEDGVQLVQVRHQLQQLDLPGAANTGSSMHIAGCKFFHDNERFVAMSTAGRTTRKLFVWDRWQHALQTIGAFAPDHTLRWGTHRPGMQPMWSPSGDMVVFDSSHDGNGWQVFAAGVAEMGAAMLPRARHGQYPWITAHDEPRHVLVDVGSKKGASIQAFLRSKWDGAAYTVHAFEPNPEHLPVLERVARRWGLGDRITVHPTAAWTEDTSVLLSTSCDVGAGMQGGRGGMGSRVWEMVAWLWRGGGADVGGSMFLPPNDAGRQHKADAVDFSSWLLKTFEARDVLVLQMDCAGCEFDVLPQMILDGSILLVDELHVKWYDGIREEYAEWPEMLEELLGLLGVAHTSTA